MQETTKEPKKQNKHWKKSAWSVGWITYPQSYLVVNNSVLLLHVPSRQNLALVLSCGR